MPDFRQYLNQAMPYLGPAMMTLGSGLNPRMAPHVMNLMQNRQNMAFRIREAEQYRQYRNRALELQEERLEADKEHRKWQREKESESQRREKQRTEIAKWIYEHPANVSEEHFGMLPDLYKNILVTDKGYDPVLVDEVLQSLESYDKGQLHSIRTGGKLRFFETRRHKHGGRMKIVPAGEFSVEEMDDDKKLVADIADLKSKIKDEKTSPGDKAKAKNLLKIKEARMNKILDEEERESGVDYQRRWTRANESLGRQVDILNAKYLFNPRDPFFESDDQRKAYERELNKLIDQHERSFNVQMGVNAKRLMKKMQELAGPAPDLMPSHGPAEPSPDDVGPTAPPNTPPDLEAQIKREHPNAYYNPADDTWYITNEKGQRQAIIISLPMPKR